MPVSWEELSEGLCYQLAQIDYNIMNTVSQVGAIRTEQSFAGAGAGAGGFTTNTQLLAMTRRCAISDTKLPSLPPFSPHLSLSVFTLCIFI